MLLSAKNLVLFFALHVIVTKRRMLKHYSENGHCLVLCKQNENLVQLNFFFYFSILTPDDSIGIVHIKDLRLYNKECLLQGMKWTLPPCSLAFWQEEQSRPFYLWSQGF